MVLGRILPAESNPGVERVVVFAGYSSGLAKSKGESLTGPLKPLEKLLSGLAKRITLEGRDKSVGRCLMMIFSCLLMRKWRWFSALKNTVGSQKWGEVLKTK